ncbi:MAG: DUF5611 family protein [Candidatus Thermoplasmatota archaeon]|nr:DUF5611 family protein [Candidatus Thermoplasmatota archaeon]
MTEADDRLRVSHGSITELTVWTDDKFLHVAVNMDRGADDEISAQTIRAFNYFLERETGFLSKQRRKRIQKRAKVGRFQRGSKIRILVAPVPSRIALLLPIASWRPMPP